jgi:hypothetical protein
MVCSFHLLICWSGFWFGGLSPPNQKMCFSLRPLRLCGEEEIRSVVKKGGVARKGRAREETGIIQSFEESRFGF